MRVLFVLAIAVIAFLGWRHWREVSRENRLAAIASELAGRPVDVACQGFFGRLVDVGPEAGLVRYDRDGRPAARTELKSWVCDRLAEWGSTRHARYFSCLSRPYPCPAALEQPVTALLVLAHESQHLRGISSESQAQCYGIQTMALVAERLGSDHDEARAMAAHFLAVQQPRQAPAYGLSAECRDEGTLDLNPGRPGWPAP